MSNNDDLDVFNQKYEIWKTIKNHEGKFCVDNNITIHVYKDIQRGKTWNYVHITENDIRKVAQW